MINIKKFDSNLLKIGKRSYKNIGIYYIAYITIKNVGDHESIHGVNLLHLITGEVDGYTEENNGNKYLIFASTNKNKEVLLKYTGLCGEIKYLIEKINNKPGAYEKDFMKIKFNSADNLALNKMLKLHNLTVIIKSVFQEDGKYYPQVFLDECLYEVLMLEYDRIDISERIDVNKTNASKSVMFVITGILLDKGYKYEPYLCNGCHDLTQKTMNFNDVAMVSVKESDYRVYFWYRSKDNAINIMNNSNLNKKVDCYNFSLSHIKMSEKAYY